MAHTPIHIPDSFPASDYTPFGYIDNPYHTAVFNRSGVIRTVPPLGFGYWARALPWPYGAGAERPVNYLSFLHLSIHLDGVGLHTTDDFRRHGVGLVSRYHTKTMMSYDWALHDCVFSARYFLAEEHALACLLEIANHTTDRKTVTFHATNIYGFPATPYWGCDGVCAVYNSDYDAGVSKVWAYGDIFVVGADRKGVSYKATSSEKEWNGWMAENDLSSNEGVVVRFETRQEGIYSVMSYQIALAPGTTDTIALALCRGVNQAAALDTFVTTVKTAVSTLNRQLINDDAFYRLAPRLTGDWPEAWKHGFIYDLETLRMTLRPPVGIYRHRWDAMQIHTPRSVLGETALDTMCVGYADIELAKEALYGVFADAPAPNVPCSREDGSMNMIGESGSECGTAPNWGFPFHVIHRLYLRDRDDHWIRKLYPHLKAYLQWWFTHRTDRDGWFHADCSWESGQDGSKRFLLDGHTPGATATNVRTVDIEAAVAQAAVYMRRYAEVSGLPQDVGYWHDIMQDRIERVRLMYADGWFRDVDAETGKPIIIEDYYDIMMFAPLALGLATPEQIEAVKSRFAYFTGHPKHWLEWPSFMFPYSEAAWNAGLREFIARVIADTGHRVYERLDRRETLSTGEFDHGLPRQYNYRIPGVSNEFWPLDLYPDNPGGCENYGWGATLPTLIIRNIIGFREADDLDADRFYLAPALPETLFKPGHTYGITNLKYRDLRSDVDYIIVDAGRLVVRLTCVASDPGEITVTDEEGCDLAAADVGPLPVTVSFDAVNGGLYTLTFHR